MTALGGRWRLLAWQLAGDEHAEEIEHTSDEHPPSQFDELVVDDWLHVEQMDEREWWLNVGGLHITISFAADGLPEQVTTAVIDPVVGCLYDGEAAS